MASKRKQGESGFALLMIFLMAAVIGITLYTEIPRVAFDSQRQKELLLVERGEQYKRAIGLFVKKNSRYPARIEELESFNNVRYLRKRFKDPITGKDEWRMIHVGPGGVLTDSVVNKPQKPGDQKAAANTNTFIAEGPAIGSAQGQGQQSVNPGMRRRQSEGGTQGGTMLGPDGLPVQPQIAGAPGIAPGDPNQQQPGAVPGQPQIPGQQQIPGQPQLPGQQGAQQQQYPALPGIPGQPPGQPIPGQAGIVGQPGIPGAVPGGQIPGQIQPGQQVYPPGMQVIGGRPGAQVPGQTGTNQQAGSYIGSSQPYIGSGSYIGGQSTTPTQQGIGRYPGMPGPPVNSQTGGVSPYSTVPGSQGISPQFPQPGMGGTGQNSAVQMIQQILTTPRPGGMPTGSGIGGTTIGGGIAGVASTSEDEGILVYNDRTKYNEWEFIYDPTKEKRVSNPNAGGIGTAADKLGTPAGQMNSQGQPNSQPSPFGNNSGFQGFGSNSGFGQTQQPQTGFGRR